MTEVWKSLKHVVELGENYEVSNLGNVRNIKLRREMTKHKSSHGYLIVHLSYGGITKNYIVHRLVMLAFVPQPHGKRYVNHIDGEKLNNALSNLEWVTARENSRHAWETGLMDNSWYIENAKGTGKITGPITIRKAIEANKKAVTQYDLDENVINTFSCIQDAAKADGVSHMIISRECNQKTIRRNRDYYFRFSKEAIQ